MKVNWKDNEPIYLQLRDRLVAMVLDGALLPGDAMPSVRQVAADYQLNPITVSRAMQELVDAGVVEKRRGIGMFVLEGAPERLLHDEREQFMQQEWPAIVRRIRRLGLDWKQLMDSIDQEDATP